MKNKKMVVVACLIIILILLWLIPFLICEYQTKKYGGEFPDMEQLYSQQFPYMRVPEGMKVIKYDTNRAEVYYYCPTGGDIVTYTKKDGMWVVAEQSVVWTQGGTHAGKVWPYFWHGMISSKTD